MSKIKGHKQAAQTSSTNSYVMYNSCTVPLNSQMHGGYFRIMIEEKVQTWTIDQLCKGATDHKWTVIDNSFIKKLS